MLKKIQIDSQYFKDARIKMADIYLNQLMDRRHYAKCYIEIVRSKESPEYYRLAGDAMLKIQEPEEAIELYEKALQNSTDATLVRDIGRALVMTHDYKKAIQYYEGALETNPNQHSLREDLAKLRIKLGQYPEAKSVIEQGISLIEKEEKSIKNIKYQVGLLLASTKLMRAEAGAGKYGKVEGLKEEYAKALEAQVSLINKLKELGSSDALEREKEFAAEVYYDLADYFENAENNRDSAKDVYVDAIRLCDSHKPSLLALAKLLSQKGDLDACVSACNKLLKIDPGNEEGTYLAAHSMFVREMPENGIGIFKSLLSLKPDNYNALASYISFAKKLGRVQDTLENIEIAAKLAGRSNETGISYVRGLYERYLGNNIESLKFLNISRGDRSFAKPALTNMIEIYMNLDSVDWVVHDQKQESALNAETLKAATLLIDELERISMNDPTVVIYRSYSEMFKRDENGLSNAAKLLSDLLKQRAEYIPGIVALAVLKFLLKKPADARDILKMVQNAPYTIAESSHIERGWLLLGNFAFIVFPLLLLQFWKIEQ
jgi:tetratricopeptide repeat protein 21B